MKKRKKIKKPIVEKEDVAEPVIVHGFEVSREDLILALTKAAKTYDRAPAEGLHPDRLAKIADELLNKNK